MNILVMQDLLPGSNPSTTTHYLCDFWQVTCLLCALFF